ncbi:hypothetical protein NXX29_02270 [Bacteroides fragilis]|nr:hypothetical protein [Bacteroides fragilis]
MEGIVLQLRQIIRHYILHGSYFADCGPLNDKMGFVLFFFHYIRYGVTPRGMNRKTFL